jgi:ABC-type multidrug transport system ATPase subunit
MELITKSQLRNVRNTFEKAQGIKTFSEFINESKTRKSTTTEVTIFLSHKHDEVEELKDAIALLKKYGVNIYIDHNDEEMPKQTSGVTADKLKKKIKENKKFILLATEKAIASKWCNWELGFGDAHKYINHIALLVIKDDNTNWTGSEYLQIYPVIGKKYSWSDDYYEVEFPDKKTVDLKTWLNS